MTIAEKITTLDGIKQDIKAAIEAKGVTVGTAPFGDYDTKISEIAGGGGGPTLWSRPTEWITLPEVPAGEFGHRLLFAVYDLPNNSIAFSCGAVGGYTVDWGNGVITTHGSATTAQYTYDYNDVALNGTLTSRGYKQVVIKVYATTSKTTSITFNGQVRPATYTGGGVPSIPILEMYSRNGNINVALTMGGSSLNVNFNQLEHIIVDDFQVSNTTFRGIRGLIKVSTPRPSLKFLNSVANAFDTCMNLKEVPPIESPLSNVSWIFNGCTALETAPTFTFTSTSLNCSSMFLNCSALRNIPTSIVYSNVTNASYMFAVCSSLVDVPATVDLTKATSFNNFITGSTRLVKLPDLVVTPANLGSGANATIGTNCTLVTSLPFFDTSAVTSATQVAYIMPSLTEIPPYNFGAVTSTLNAFFQSSNIRRFRAFGLRINFSVSNSSLGVDAINEMLTNLGVPASSATVTITNNPGATPNISRGVNINTSYTATTTSTSDLSVGMYLSGAPFNNVPRSIVFTNGSDEVSITGINGTTQFVVGKQIVWAVSAAGIVAKQIYYITEVVSSTTTSAVVRISTTPGGTPFVATADWASTGYMAPQITSITAGSGYIFDLAATVSGTQTVVHRLINTEIANRRSWTITG